MNKKKIKLVILLPFLCSSFLFSQSLVELAKKEKERRAKLKGKESVVVTNADLKKVQIKPVLSSQQLQAPQTPQPEPQPSTQPSNLETTPPSQTSEAKEGAVSATDELETKWIKAKENSAALKTKLELLWREYNDSDNEAIRSHLKKQIGQIYDQFKQARQEIVNSRKEMLVQEKKEE